MPEIDVLIEAAAGGPGPGRARAAGRLMTLLENEPQRLPELYRWLPRDRWPSPLVLGITGAPGSGKSTLVDAVVAELRRRRPGAPVGVVAVDPSSPFTGGAVLGDRVRMMRHGTDPLVFIRSLATRGHLGGLSLGVRGVLRVMGLIGCDVVLLETVGVGQSEVEVARVADRVAVVLAPGAGDSIQMLKAGLLEVGDFFIVNKADTPGADALHRSLLQALSLARTAETIAVDEDHHGHGTEQPVGRADVLLASATLGEGVPAVVDWMLSTDDARMRGPPGGQRDQVTGDVREAVLEASRHRLERALDENPSLLEKILGGGTSVAEVVEALFASESGA